MRLASTWFALSWARDPFNTGVMYMTAEEAAEYNAWCRRQAFGVRSWPLSLNGRRIELAEEPIPWRLPND